MRLSLLSMIGRHAHKGTAQYARRDGDEFIMHQRLASFLRRLLHIILNSAHPLQGRCLFMLDDNTSLARITSSLT